MSQRATPASPLFVQALNSIDVEFDGDDDKRRAVRNAWKVPLDHLSALSNSNNTFPPD